MHDEGIVEISGVARDLWVARNWSQQFPKRTSLAEELGLLDRLFPFEWRREALREPHSKHQLRGDLATLGGRTRLLILAAELLRVIRLLGLSQIPMQGRLRCWSLYEPTKSELLVRPILRAIGDVTWQPEGAGHGADYRVTGASGTQVAEVKRACTSRRQDRAAMDRVVADPSRTGPIFTPDEQLDNTREDARRLYPRVRHAARQLGHSSAKAARRFGGSARSVPGMLFLDLDGNRGLVNVSRNVCRWMKLPWAKSIDIVLFFDYGYRRGAWGTIAEPIYTRSARALEALERGLPYCTRGHFHVGNLPSDSCEFPLPL